jgi:multiple sugar transport system substrate-binding protein
VPAFTEKQAAALEFIKWAESKEMGLKMAKEINNTSCRSSVWADKDAMAAFAPDMLKAMIESRSIAIGGDRPTVINVGEARDILSVPIQAAIMGEDPTDALAQAHTKFQELIDKENKQ